MRAWRIRRPTSSQPESDRQGRHVRVNSVRVGHAIFRPVRWTTLVFAGALAALAMVVGSAGPWLPSAMISAASAQPCPEVEVVFARGQDEPPGMGMVGDTFVGVLRGRTGKDIGSYAVNYPAKNGDIAPGVADMSGHITSMAANCPNTRLVVGGYSLGGAVTNEVLANHVAPGADQHVAAVVTFGNASRLVGAPISPGPQYGGKTYDICNPGDPICSDGDALLSHFPLLYILGVSPAADFVAARI
jgi:cutinase